MIVRRKHIYPGRDTMGQPTGRWYVAYYPLRTAEQLAAGNDGFSEEHFETYDGAARRYNELTEVGNEPGFTSN